MHIGSYKLHSSVILAPMAGVSDRPFRQLCRRYGAALAVSEMMAANPELWHTRKSLLRMDHNGETGIRSVQIVGSEPEQLADAARFNVASGAQIIDINMGCPAKKVCNKAAGSSLLRDEKLVAAILEAVVKAVSVPVTLKIRTGWCPSSKNALQVARIAENAGIQALTIHGRTRACRFEGTAEYDTIALVKSGVRIPVIANGDIDTPEKARQVLDYTGADAVMIGRAAQGQPWLIRDIIQFLEDGTSPKPPSLTEITEILHEHVEALHDFYGEQQGLRIARKHVGWTLARIPLSSHFRQAFYKIETAELQRIRIRELPYYLTTQKKEYSL
jgi:tRNA-dihydrouridine synthase B